MPNIGKDAKHTRRNRVDRFIQQYPNGVTESEIADHLAYERRTVNNYLRDLEIEGKIYKEGKLWCPLPHISRQLRHVQLSPEEGMVLYLASRLLVQQTDFRNEVAEQVLIKLASVLCEDAQLSDDIIKVADELIHLNADYMRLSVYKLIMQSYIYRRNIQIVYQPYKGNSFETIFSPYLVEPSAIGYATYVIGFSSISGAIRTYKIERIKEAHLSRDEFTIPHEFDGLKLLKNAWSIYYGDDLVQVTLRFSPEVAKRIKESIWHPSQRLEIDPSNSDYLLMEIEVADTTDLKPWIRTWGAHCEVLEPEELRNEFVGEARQQAYLYGWTTTSNKDDDHSRFDDIFGR